MTDRVAELIGIVSANINTDSVVATRAVNKANRELAVEFGRRQGWKLTTAGFALSKLSRRPARELGQWSSPGLYDSYCMDHPFYYRDENGPVAVAAHLYAGERKEADVIAFAERLGCAVSLDEDFPSWWYPGQTRLVVYRRLAP